MHLTWLDNNSWLIEMGGQRILLDPWLTGSLVFGNFPWLFKGQHTQPRTIPEQIGLILLSQGLEDHTHPETLQKLDHGLPVVASPNAAKIVKAMGFTQVTALAHGESLTVGDRLRLQAVPGSPVGPLLVENGYLLTDTATGEKLYYEPHGNHSPDLQSAAPVDVVITPVIDLDIPLLGPVIKGRKSAVEVVKWLQPRAILPTAAGGDVKFEGVLVSVLRAQGSVEEFRQQLVQQELTTQVLAPRPGERLEV
ncbi:MAG: MBL fold metallo-hydrolase [Cyanobacteria bacterium RM1_2_2]|nr:MBL fold metallo-hydrolase [Cyanobacteria bacterium RM1_2_2]